MKGEPCPLCAKQLQVYQINLTESITMCPNTQCSFPLGCGQTLSQIITSRSFTDIRKPTTFNKHRQTTFDASKQKSIHTHNSGTMPTHSKQGIKPMHGILKSPPPILKPPSSKIEASLEPSVKEASLKPPRSIKEASLEQSTAFLNPPIVHTPEVSTDNDILQQSVFSNDFIHEFDLFAPTLNDEPTQQIDGDFSGMKDFFSPSVVTSSPRNDLTESIVNISPHKNNSIINVSPVKTHSPAQIQAFNTAQQNKSICDQIDNNAVNAAKSHQVERLVTNDTSPFQISSDTALQMDIENTVQFEGQRECYNENLKTTEAPTCVQDTLMDISVNCQLTSPVSVNNQTNKICTDITNQFSSRNTDDINTAQKSCEKTLMQSAIVKCHEESINSTENGPNVHHHIASETTKCSNDSLKHKTNPNLMKSDITVNLQSKVSNVNDLEGNEVSVNHVKGTQAEVVKGPQAEVDVQPLQQSDTTPSTVNEPRHSLTSQLSHLVEIAGSDKQTKLSSSPKLNNCIVNELAQPNTSHPVEIVGSDGQATVPIIANDGAVCIQNYIPNSTAAKSNNEAVFSQSAGNVPNAVAPKSNIVPVNSQPVEIALSDTQTNLAVVNNVAVCSQTDSPNSQTDSPSLIAPRTNAVPVCGHIKQSSVDDMKPGACQDTVSNTVVNNTSLHSQIHVPNSIVPTPNIAASCSQGDQTSLSGTQTNIPITHPIAVHGQPNPQVQSNNISVHSPVKQQPKAAADEVKASPNATAPKSATHSPVRRPKSVADEVKASPNATAPKSATGHSPVRRPKSVADELKAQNSSPNAKAHKSNTVLSPVRRPKPPVSVKCRDKFLQWENSDALCWLDVSMVLLVHCTSFCNLLKSCPSQVLNKRRCLLYKLCSVYYTSRDLLKQALEFQSCSELARQGRSVTLQTSIGKITVKTAGGGSTPGGLSALTFGEQASPSTNQDEWIMSPDELDERAQSLIEKALSSLEAIRKKLWNSLQPRMKCQLGKNDSPVFALPLLWREHALFEGYFQMKYEWKMQCTQCGYQHVDRQEKCLPSFPAVPADFCMLVPYFSRPCFQCQEPAQQLHMVYDSLPEAFVIHFVDGLHAESLSSYDFSHQGQWYVVKCVVQYRSNPDHFVAWVRDPIANLWMECDGLKAPICSFTGNQPTFCLSQVHLLLWERVAPSVNFQPDPAALRLLEQTARGHVNPVLSSVGPRYEPTTILISSSPDTPADHGPPTLTSADHRQPTLNPGPNIIHSLNGQLLKFNPRPNMIATDGNAATTGLNGKSPSLNPNGKSANLNSGPYTSAPQFINGKPSLGHNITTIGAIGNGTFTTSETVVQENVAETNTISSSFTASNPSCVELDDMLSQYVTQNVVQKQSNSNNISGIKHSESSNHAESVEYASKCNKRTTSDFANTELNQAKKKLVVQLTKLSDSQTAKYSPESSSLNATSSILDKTSFQPDKTRQKIVTGLTLGGKDRTVFVSGLKPIALQHSGNKQLSETNSGKIKNSMSSFKNYTSDRTSKQLANIIATTAGNLNSSNKNLNVSSHTKSDISCNKNVHSSSNSRYGAANNSSNIDSQRYGAVNNSSNIVSQRNNQGVHLANEHNIAIGHQLNKPEPLVSGKKAPKNRHLRGKVILPLSNPVNTKADRKVSSALTSEDRLQKLRAKLNVLKQTNSTQRVNAIMSAINVPPVTNHSLVYKNDNNKRPFVAKDQLQSHIPEQHPAKQPRKSVLNVMNSPSQQKSSVQEILARVRGNSKPAGQMFDGYRSKAVINSVPLEDNTANSNHDNTSVTSKYAKLLSPTKRSTQKVGGRKIRFDDSPSSKRKGKTGAAASRKRVNLTQEFVSSASEPGVKSRKTVNTAEEFLAKVTKAPAKSRKNNMVVNIGTVVEGYTVENGVKMSLHRNVTSLSGEIVPPSGQNIKGNRSVPNDNFVTDSSFKMNGIHNNTSGETNGIHSISSAVTNSNYSNAVVSGDPLEAVMSELCATLDIPVTKQPITDEPAGGNQPIQGFFEANMPGDLNKSGDFDHIDFDTFLFGDSPVKTSEY